MTFEDRLAETLNRTLPKLGPEARLQLAALIEPEAIALMAGVLVAWIVSHAVGLGEIIDILVGVIGAVSIGWAVFVAIDHIYDFAVGVYRGTLPPDFDAAAEHLAKAISIIGIQAVLAVLFKGARMPKTWKGRPIEVGPAPPSIGGIRYSPTITERASLKAGEGFTTFWGNITVSTRGSAEDRALVLIHEKVHQFLAPKLYLLREYRVNARAGSYMRSSLWRYIEEALAETIARVGVNGFQNSFVGIRFPLRNHYVYFTRGGGFAPKFEGFGVLRESAALIHTCVVSGIAFELWLMPDAPPVRN